MNHPRQQEEMLFNAARMLTEPKSRAAFLDQACADDTDMRHRLEELLAAQIEAEKFFGDASAAKLFSLSNGDTNGTRTPGTNGHATEAALSEAPGARIGRYKLLQRIGEGGGGVVYMAEQEEPVRRRVALKIIKLGMDTKSVIARFEAERQALAMMDHPNIARVLDAGATETGRPYFVMELVRGVKITDYCDQNHRDTRRRLDLFIQICHAIQHAHQKGIIHRDIKPSNVLVTLHDGVPVPKIIDFGIAKATEMRLTDKTLFTAYEQFVGTPAYMSPEQAEMSGLDIDTRSDIYSLGVLLYELLTGKTPFDPKKLLQSGLDGMRRTLREREPQRPSTMLTTMLGEELKATAIHREAEPPKLVSLLKGDLDWIVMKALEKDRTRRYETANGLAMDIKRYLHNEPVVARPPSRLYRFHKLVRRNKVVFAAGGAVAAALVVGLGTSTWLLFKEREALQRAVAAEQQQMRLRQDAERERQKTEIRGRIKEAGLLTGQERFDEAEDRLIGVSFTESSLEGAAALRSLGEWHALEGRWQAATERFLSLLQVNQLDVWDTSSLDFLECGASLIEQGDHASYERFRRAAATRFADTANPVTAERIVKISLVLPAAGEFVQSLSQLADVAQRSSATYDNSVVEDPFRAAWRAVSLALMEYRRGEYAKAAEWCGRCLGNPENAPRVATARIILAMSHYQLGQLEEARGELLQGREIIEKKFRNGLDRGSGPSGFWFDWVIAKILLSEATALIEKTP